VPVLAGLVVVDEIGISLLRPTPRHLIEVVRKDAHGYRDGDPFGSKKPNLLSR
jgi:hypothetical protein